MSISENNLTAKQETVLAALLSEPTATAAAKKAGIGLTTLMRWLAEPTFAGAYRAARGQLLETTLASLQAASGDAVKTLRGVLTDESARAGEKVSASKAILEFSLKLREVTETEQRLCHLESLLAGVQARKRA